MVNLSAKYILWNVGKWTVIFLIMTRVILEVDTKAIVDNNYSHEWNQEELLLDYPNPRSSKLSRPSRETNSSTTFSAEFKSCIKWSLIRREDFVLLPNYTLRLLCNNNTDNYSVDYFPGQYELSKDQQIAHVCIPISINAYLYPVDYAFVTVWTISIFALIISIIILVWITRTISKADVRPMFCLQFSLLILYSCLVFLNANAFEFDSGWRNWFMIGSDYFQRSAFCWLNVNSIVMWKTFNPQQVWFQSPPTPMSRFRFVRYSLYGWGLPALMLLIAYLLHYLPFPDDAIVSSSGLLYATFLQLAWMRASVSLLVLFNVFFCSLATVNLHRIQNDLEHSKLITDAHIQRYSVYVKIVMMSSSLFLVDTVQWFIVRQENFFFYWLIPDWLTCGQGIWVFLITCCNKPVLRGTRNKIAKLCL